MVIQDPVVHRWCRGCGAVYVFRPKLGWHWLKANRAHKTVLPSINYDPRIGR